VAANVVGLGSMRRCGGRGWGAFDADGALLEVGFAGDGSKAPRVTMLELVSEKWKGMKT
jgi:hypothetical protein